MSKFRLGVPVLPGTTGGKGDTKKNVQHSTFNAQRSNAGGAGVVWCGGGNLNDDVDF
ncbi:MAG: hypothetical protein QGF00_07520 [Planctomycetota bacterium]|jgi:hypothetical protein|nr:hypothetical protein [Planctomycetota bacterium]